MDRFGEDEWSGQALLVSEKYPMTAAALLVSAARLALKEISGLPETGVPLDQNYLQSTFKFLKRYSDVTEQAGYKNGTMIKSGRLLTVYSSPCESRRKRPVSSELPQYVKRIMQSDPSLRRLIKEGSITISRISSACDEDVDTLTSNLGLCDESSISTELLRRLAAEATKNENCYTFQERMDDKDRNSESDARVEEPRLSNGLRVERMHSNSSISIKFTEKQRKIDMEQNKPTEGIDISTFLEVSLQEQGGGDEKRRKFACLKCPKRFCWSTDLKRHALTHTGERPFKCQHCGSTFTRKFLMQKHVRKHHLRNELEVGVPEEYDLHALEEDAEASRYPSDGTDDENSMSSRSNDKADILTLPTGKHEQPIVVNVYSSMDEIDSAENPEAAQSNGYSSCSQDSYTSIGDPVEDEVLLDTYKRQTLSKVAVFGQS